MNDHAENCASNNYNACYQCDCGHDLRVSADSKDRLIDQQKRCIDLLIQTGGKCGAPDFDRDPACANDPGHEGPHYYTFHGYDGCEDYIFTPTGPSPWQVDAEQHPDAPARDLLGEAS